MDEIVTRYGIYTSDDLVYLETYLDRWITHKRDHKLWNLLNGQGVPIFGLAHAQERRNALPGNFGDIRILLHDWYNNPLPENQYLIPSCGERSCISQNHLKIVLITKGT